MSVCRETPRSEADSPREAEQSSDGPLSSRGLSRSRGDLTALPPTAL